jgi:hypothetical protein
MDRQQRLQRPQYPSLQTSSQTSSPFHSYSSLSSVSSQGSLLSPNMPQNASSAPLPSPTVSHQAQYFGSIHPQQTQQSQSHAQYAQQYAQQQQQHPHQQQQQPHNQQQEQQKSMSGYHYQPDRAGAGQTAPETARYLGDFGLVAEAAKRAQMAVLMRDMEGVELR